MLWIRNSGARQGDSGARQGARQEKGSGGLNQKPEFAAADPPWTSGAWKWSGMKAKASAGSLRESREI